MGFTLKDRGHIAHGISLSDTIKSLTSVLFHLKVTQTATYTFLSSKFYSVGFNVALNSNTIVKSLISA